MKIDVTNVTKFYQQEKVLDQIDIHLQAVEVVALLGKSGSGKSTLLRLMSGMEADWHWIQY